MRTVSRAGHVYDIDLEQVGLAVFAVFLSVRLERFRLNDPLVKVQVTVAEREYLKKHMNGTSQYSMSASHWELDAISGVPIELLDRDGRALSV